MPPPDWVFPVRAGESNDELRFALRSLMNVPHGKVWIVGYKPSWVKNVGFIEGGNSAKWVRANLYRNLMLACAHPDLPEDIVITNDDIFLTDAITHVPVLYRGRLADQIGLVRRRGGGRGWWPETLATTQTCLQNIGLVEPLSYELHVPFPCNRIGMGWVLSRFAEVAVHNPPQWRTLYGNICGIGGTKHHDGKALRPGPICRPYHSTEDSSWRYFRTRFMQMFPDPSPYERVVADARSLVSVSPRNHLRSTRRITPA